MATMQKPKTKRRKPKESAPIAQVLQHDDEEEINHELYESSPEPVEPPVLACTKTTPDSVETAPQNSVEDSPEACTKTTTDSVETEPQDSVKYSPEINEKFIEIPVEKSKIQSEELLITQAQDQQASAPVEASSPIVETFARLRMQVGNLARQLTQESAPAVEAVQQTTRQTIASSPLLVKDVEEVYTCHEIARMRMFEERLLNDAREENFEDHDLYLLLSAYMEERLEIQAFLNDIESTRENINEAAENVWIKEKRRDTFEGICGDNRTVKTSADYEVLIVDSTQLEFTSTLLTNFQKQLCEKYLMHIFQAKQVKAEIDYTVREIVHQLSVIASNPSVVRMDLEQCIQHLRLAVSILFCFLRKPVQDKLFVNDVRHWLLHLVAVQSRLTISEDHWFLLFHLLRCPTKIAWGTGMVQVPHSGESDKSNIFIDSSMTLLSIILSPIRSRNEFLKACSDAHRNISDTTKGDVWILVDSDGEEGSTPAGECVGPKESDLIDLLNQIPFENLFRIIMNIDQPETEDHSAICERMTEKQLMKIISFNATLIKLLGNGLRTYGSERYRQFTKRLGFLMKHCIHYTYDCYEIFLKNYADIGWTEPERVRDKFDAFILSACDCLYKSRCMGVSQFFQNMPFGGLHKRTLYGIFYFLNVGFPEEISLTADYEALIKDSNFWNEFNTNAKDAPNEDLLYLLQTFLEMALARDRATDWEFITMICNHIFYIGYINEATRNICYKTCKDVLSSLTQLYPELISDLISFSNVNLAIIEYADYMFKSLPLEIWRPDPESLELVCSWLQNYSYETKENILGRIIIGRMNWGYTAENELFLPREIHARLACVICAAAAKHAPDIHSPTTRTAQTSQGVVDLQSLKEQFVNWCWNMISALHLHYMDQGRRVAELMLRDPAGYLRFIPDLNGVDVIFQGVTEGRPLAIYLSILLTLRGHSIPLICQKTLDQLPDLLLDERYTVVIRCLQLITIVFVENAEVLSECDRFHRVLQDLFNCDKTYINMAKNTFLDYSFGSTVELFKDMLQTQILNFADYGLASPQLLINLWLKTLLNLTNWEDPSVLYVLDGVLKVTHRFPYSWWEAKNYFRAQFAKLEKTKESKSTLKTLFGSNKSKRRANEKFPWYSLMSLEVEHELYEGESRLWIELLHQYKIDKNTGLENAVKHATSRCGIQHYQAMDLSVFKYAEIIANISHEHYLLPILAQQFFLLYLHRIPYTPDEERCKTYFGIANKFNEYDPGLMKRVKVQFKAAEDYYSKGCLEATESETQISSPLSDNLTRLFKAYQLWMEDMTINALSKNQHLGLPPQYFPEKLVPVFSGIKDHWIEFLNTEPIGLELNRSVDFWQKCCFRHNPARKLVERQFRQKPRTDPVQRILNHLKSYDRPEERLQLHGRQHRVGNVDLDDANCDIFKLLKSCVRILSEYSKKCNTRSQDLTMLNKMYEESLSQLYIHVPRNQIQQVKCTSIFSAPIYSCTKPARVTVTIKVPLKNAQVDKEVETNREKFNKLVDFIIMQDFNEAVVPVESLQYIIKFLNAAYFKYGTNAGKMKNVSKICIDSFYELVESFENIMSFAPSHELWRKLIASLGVFINKHQNTEGIKVLKAAIANPAIIDVLSEMITPATTDTKYFINMYQALIDSHRDCCEPKITSILLSKFDLKSCLPNFQPNLSEVNHLLKLIFLGLERWSTDDALQTTFRLHLIYIFEYDFPEHYGEVLQALLVTCINQKLKANVITEVLNSLLVRSGCDAITDAKQDEAYNQIRKFAANQKLFDFKSIMETIAMLAEHYRQERIKYGLHGLYPSYAKYCEPLAILFACFGHVALISAIHTYPGELAEQISERIFLPIMEMYAPWTISYNEHHLRGCTMNWIWQLVKDGKCLHPWSEVQAESAKVMLESLVNTLRYATVVLAVPSSILGQVFGWYFYNFVNRETAKSIRGQVHNALIQLPWEHFYPQLVHLEMIHMTLLECLPDIHAFVGYIFLKVQWSEWFNQLFINWGSEIQTQSINFLYAIMVKIAFEPNLHTNGRTSQIITESLNFPWHRVAHKVVEDVFNWITNSLEPIFILQLPSENNATDVAVLRLIKCVSSMRIRDTERSSYTSRTKRLIYVQKMMELLKKCGTKNKALIEKPEGEVTIKNVIVEIMLDIENIAKKSDEFSRSQDDEVIGLLSVVLDSSWQCQNDFIKKLIVDSLIMWQSKHLENREILANIFDVIAPVKYFDSHTLSFLESTIYHYLHRADTSSNDHLSAWKTIEQKLGKCFHSMDLMALIQGQYLLILHIFIIYKMQFMDYTTQITLIQDIVQLLETIKASDEIEPKLAVLWGAIMSIGFQTLPFDDNANKPLIMLARNLVTYAGEADSWSSGLLGMVGLKRAYVTNRFIMLSRCLACLIFSFCDERQSYTTSLEELKSAANARKNSDIRVLSKRGVDIIEENMFVTESIANRTFSIIQLFYNDNIINITRHAWTSEECTIRNI